MRIRINSRNLDYKQILHIVDLLKNDGVIIFPTDTVYGIGCSIMSAKAFDRVARLKGVQKEKANFSFICYDLSHLSDYAAHVNNSTFKLLKKYLPGPYTFILEASRKVPKLFRNKKKTIGIRVPDNSIIREIAKELGVPLMTTSLHDDDELIDYTTDPDIIYEQHKDDIDCFVDGGYGHNQPSTVIDCTGTEPIIVREGKGEIL